MIRTSIEKIGEIVVVRERGTAEKNTLLEGVIKNEYIGFSFYEDGEAVIYDTGNKRIGKKGRMSWSTFFVSPEFGNIYREIPPSCFLSQVTILYPFNIVRQRFRNGLNSPSLFQNLLNPGEIYLDVKQRIAVPAIIQPALKILNCAMISTERELYLESQCLEILSQISFQLKAENTSISLSSGDLEKLEKAKEVLVSDFQRTPSLSDLSLSVGMNTYILMEGFKVAFALPLING